MRTEKCIITFHFKFNTFNIIKIFLTFIFIQINIYCIAQPDTVKIGTFVTSIHDFNLIDNTFSGEMHLWCLYKNNKFNFEKELEIKNSNSVNFSNSSIEETNNGYWYYVKSLFTIRKNWNTKSYPFDKQILHFTLESSEHDISELIFQTDSINTKVAESVQNNLNEWKITKSNVYADSTIYSTNFGNSNLSEKSVYSDFNLDIELERKFPYSILFKLITGLLVSFTIALCVFFINPIHTDPRFGLCVGALFAAVGNKYIIEGLIPPNSNLSMLDLLHNITFIFIILIIISSVISLKLYEMNTDSAKIKAKRFDLLMFITFLFSFIAFFGVIVFNHNIT